MEVRFSFGIETLCAISDHKQPGILQELAGLSQLRDDHERVLFTRPTVRRYPKPIVFTVQH
jgi:hypothetical protein